MALTAAAAITKSNAFLIRSHSLPMQKNGSGSQANIQLFTALPPIRGAEVGTPTDLRAMIPHLRNFVPPMVLLRVPGDPDHTCWRLLPGQHALGFPHASLVNRVRLEIVVLARGGPLRGRLRWASEQGTKSRPPPGAKQNCWSVHVSRLLSRSLQIPKVGFSNACCLGGFFQRKGFLATFSE